jgi:hypothetical protein
MVKVTSDGYSASRTGMNASTPPTMTLPRLLALAVCLLGMIAVTGQDSSAQTPPSPTPAPGVQHPGRGHHPAIRMAINALERAKAEMQAAAHDFGGHRVDAIAACDTAIAQLKLALQYANGNTPSGETPAPPSTQ